MDCRVGMKDQNPEGFGDPSSYPDGRLHLLYIIHIIYNLDYF